MATRWDRHAARLTLAALALMAFALGAAQEVSGWTLVSSSHPSARCMHAMASDTDRQRIVLFGGFNGHALGDTWEWDGTRWRRISISGPAPQPRYMHAMAYDDHRHCVVLHGGVNAGGDALGDTWEWDGAHWHNRGNSGPQVYGHALAYDSAHRRTVLFGGANEDHDSGELEAHDDTYVWNGAVWMHPAHSGPQGRYLHAMAYDARRERIVMFGGRTPGYTDSQTHIMHDPVVHDDHWEWNGTQWLEKPHVGMSETQQQTMAWDPVRQRVLMFGGRGNGHDVRTTYSYTGQAWVLDANNGPAGRESPAMAWDAVTQRMIMFGGRASQMFKDTWAFEP